jgi:hypothetical protein
LYACVHPLFPPCLAIRRQAGLIDNVSEYNDVVELYRVQISNKMARIPPSQQQAAEIAGKTRSPPRQAGSEAC